MTIDSSPVIRGKAEYCACSLLLDDKEQTANLAGDDYGLRGGY